MTKNLKNENFPKFYKKIDFSPDASWHSQRPPGRSQRPPKRSQSSQKLKMVRDSNMLKMKKMSEIWKVRSFESNFFFFLEVPKAEKVLQKLQKLQKCSKVFKSVQKCSKVHKSGQKCSKVLKSAQKVTKSERKTFKTPTFLARTELRVVSFCSLDHFASDGMLPARFRVFCFRWLLRPWDYQNRSKHAYCDHFKVRFIKIHGLSVELGCPGRQWLSSPLGILAVVLITHGGTHPPMVYRGQWRGDGKGDDWSANPV